MMRSSNPALRADTFKGLRAASSEDVMTLEGTALRTGLLLLGVVCSAAFTWQKVVSFPAAAVPWMIGGVIGGLLFALATYFKKTWAPVTATGYALCEGLFLGAVSAMYEVRFGGIVLQAVGLTFGVLAMLLVAYVTRLIRATENFKLGVFAATAGIGLVYLATWILSFFGVRIPYIHDSGWIGIGFSAFVVAIAALSLVMDFDFIEEGVRQGAPKYMSWYAAFGLLVTLVWLYLEILRLLSKLRSRN